jgi:hypothetical protein
MPQQLPQIPVVDKQTSYQGLKGIVAKLRDEFIRSYLVDSASVTIVDNPGKTRSAEVNFPNQGATLALTSYSDSGTTYSLAALESVILSWTPSPTIAGTVVYLDGASMDKEIIFNRCLNTTGGDFYIYLYNSDPASPHTFDSANLTIVALA